MHEGVLKGAQRERKIISSKGAQRNNSNWMSNSGAERSAQGSAKRVKTPFFCKMERKRERQKVRLRNESSSVGQPKV